MQTTERCLTDVIFTFPYTVIPRYFHVRRGQVKVSMSFNENHLTAISDSGTTFGLPGTSTEMIPESMWRCNPNPNPCDEIVMKSHRSTPQ